jgi:predicted secreted hydrolase
VVTPGRLDQEVVDPREQARSYWEGTCEVSGSAAGRAYVELVGYCRE